MAGWGIDTIHVLTVHVFTIHVLAPLDQDLVHPSLHDGDEDEEGTLVDGALRFSIRTPQAFPSLRPGQYTYRSVSIYNTIPYRTGLVA